MNPENHVNPYEPPSAQEEKTKPPLPPVGVIVASPRARLGAAMVDVLVILLGAAPGYLLMLLSSSGSHDSLPAIGVISSAWGFFSALIYQWYLISVRGQTIGKKRFNIKIVRLDGLPLGFMRGVVLRVWLISIFLFVPGVGPILGLVDVLMILGSERRTLHDRLAGTRVIKVD